MAHGSSLKFQQELVVNREKFAFMALQELIFSYLTNVLSWRIIVFEKFYWLNLRLMRSSSSYKNLYRTQIYKKWPWLTMNPLALNPFHSMVFKLYQSKKYQFISRISWSVQLGTLKMFCSTTGVKKYNFKYAFLGTILTNTFRIKGW